MAALLVSLSHEGTVLEQLLDGEARSGVVCIYHVDSSESRQRGAAGLGDGRAMMDSRRIGVLYVSLWRR